MKKNKLFPKESVHFSVKNRKHFKSQMWLILLGLILVLMGCAAMFYFGNVVWNPDEGFEPGPEYKYWWQILLNAIAGVLSVGTIVAYVIINYRIFKCFYTTQAVYWKTSDFKKAKTKATDMDLFKLKKKDLKWYKKIGYINSEQYKTILEEQKIWIKSCKQNNKKINYAHTKA